MMDGASSFAELVQQLLDVESALDVVERLQMRPEWAYLREREGAYLSERDRLTKHVLDEAAVLLTQLLRRPVSRIDLECLAGRQALEVLSAALYRQRTQVHEALDSAVSVPPTRQRTEPHRRSVTVTGIALAIGIGVLAATAGTPLAALAVGESVKKELVKAAISGLVASLVTEGARTLMERDAEPEKGTSVEPDKGITDLEKVERVSPTLTLHRTTDAPDDLDTPLTAPSLLAIPLRREDYDRSNEEDPLVELEGPSSF